MASGVQRDSGSESVVGDLHGDARAVAGYTGKSPSASANKAGARDAMGRGRHKGGEKEVGRENIPEKPEECGATTRAARPTGWPTSSSVWGTRRGHRWDLPVLHYHKIMVTYPYPFFAVITQFFS